MAALGPPPAAPAAGRETFFDFSAIHLLTDDEYTRPAARTRPEEDGLEPEFPPAALAFGSGIHGAAAFVFRGGSDGTPPSLADV